MMTRRRSLTRNQRIAIFDDADGICHLCELPILPGKEEWQAEHPTALALCGSDKVEDMRPAHKKCHAVKTAKEDIPRIAKAVRQRANHLGVKRHQGRPMPGTKASGIRKPMGGGPPIDRKTGKEL